MNILSLLPPEVKVSPANIQSLVALEYDLIAADAAIGDVVSRLAVLALDGVGEEVGRLRQALRSILFRLDKPITEAALMAEQTEPAPF